MVNELFTSNLPKANETTFKPSIHQALEELQKNFPEQKIIALIWNDFYIAVPLILKVSLPSRGPVNDADIRKEEPVFLLLHKQNYPYSAPLARSNRPDFPKESLPHLNPQHPGNPSSFCLHRGDMDTWFSEHTITEYVERIQEWLADAASDRLIRSEDGFESTRLDKTFGYCIYEPSYIQKKIITEWRNHHNRAGFCFILYRLLKNPKKEPLVKEGSTFAICLEYTILNSNISKILKLVKEFNSNYSEKFPIDRYILGILIWPPKDFIYSKFIGELPGNLKQLFELTEKLQLPLKKALTPFLSENLQILGGIPVTFVIPRSQHILRSDSTLELLNFLIIHDTWSKSFEDIQTLNEKVWAMKQISPLTISRAKEISSTPPDFDIGKVLFLGCGSIGSKLALHIIKSGRCTKMTFADFDDISPHNLVRHGLLGESLGKNKADAMKETVEKMYYAEPNGIQVNVINDNILNIFLGKTHETLCQHNWLIDATASISIREVLITEPIPSSLSVLRCEIADNGRLGFLSIEGPRRNPRVYDILYYLFDLAKDRIEISRWLQSIKKQRQTNPETILEEIQIGISCSSDTMKIGDDCISFHTSLFSLGFHRKCSEKSLNCKGLLQVSFNDLTHTTDISIQTYEIPPVLIFQDDHYPKWQIRVKSGIKEELLELLHNAGKNETGGILLGHIDQQKKIVYITRILPAPPDSKCWPIAFERGVTDVPEEVKEFRDRTGGLIDYLGEWHTHPNGSKKLSSVDNEAVRKIRNTLDPVFKPTLVMVVTKDGLNPYIFPTGEVD